MIRGSDWVTEVPASTSDDEQCSDAPGQHGDANHECRERQSCHNFHDHRSPVVGRSTAMPIDNSKSEERFLNKYSKWNFWFHAVLDHGTGGHQRWESPEHRAIDRKRITRIT